VLLLYKFFIIFYYISCFFFFILLYHNTAFYFNQYIFILFSICVATFGVSTTFFFFGFGMVRSIFMLHFSVSYHLRWYFGFIYYKSLCYDYYALLWVSAFFTFYGYFLKKRKEKNQSCYLWNVYPFHATNVYKFFTSKSFLLQKKKKKIIKKW